VRIIERCCKFDASNGSYAHLALFVSSRDDEKTAEEDAKKAHEAWLRRKDSTRIRLPSAIIDGVRTFGLCR